MKNYPKLAKYNTFSLSDVNRITGNESTSMSLISRLLKKNYIVRIRKDLYTCIDLATGDIIANKYQIASSINDGAYISHHTAFEFYGVANQLYNILYVSSEKKFNAFEFMGNTYKYIKSSFYDGVENVKNIENIRITDLERTFIDSINSISKFIGIEEMIKITNAIDRLDSKRLVYYMDKYNKKVLYQKVGYFLENYYYGEPLNKDFFELCHLKSGKSVRYLIAGRDGRFNSTWKLIIPEEYLSKAGEQELIDEYV